MPGEMKSPCGPVADYARLFAAIVLLGAYYLQIFSVMDLQTTLLLVGIPVLRALPHLLASANRSLGMNSGHKFRAFHAPMVITSLYPPNRL